MRDYFHDAGVRLLLATKPSDASTDGHNAGEIVVGLAVWQRCRKSKRAGEWKVRTLGTKMRSIYLKMLYSVTIDRSMMGLIDRWKLDRNTKETEEEVGDLKVKDSDDQWELHLLAVLPEWQGHGIGAQLLEWGLSKAQAEGVPVVLSAAPTVVAFYRKQGFSVMAKSLRDGEVTDKT